MPTDPTFVTTLTNIANLALEDIGEAPKDFLTDPIFDDNTGLIAGVVQRHMYVTIRRAQSLQYWDCLYTWQVLTAPLDLTADPTTPWGYSYPLPDDFLLGNWDDSFSHEIRANKIYCNVQDDLRFDYQRYSIDPSEWPQTLIDVVRGLLGISIIIPISENDSKLQQLMTIYEGITLPTAARMDAYAKKTPNSRWKQQDYAATRGRRRYGPDDRRRY